MQYAAANPARFIAGLFAGTALGCLLAWALVSLFNLPLFVAAAAGVLVLYRVALGVASASDIVPFSLPNFEPEPMVFDTDAGERFHSIDNVVALMGSEPVETRAEALPTVRELQATIARHLGADLPPEAPEAAADLPPRADATDELRDAIEELRRSLG